jgi:hypothetical protein
MTLPWLVAGTLCVWRLAHLLVAEAGPWQAMRRLRALAGGGFWSELLDCFYCLSLWIAVPVALLAGEGWIERLVLWPALSGGAILLERATAPASYVEDAALGTEDGDGMLRQAGNDP